MSTPNDPYGGRRALSERIDVLIERAERAEAAIGAAAEKAHRAADKLDVAEAVIAIHVRARTEAEANVARFREALETIAQNGPSGGTACAEIAAETLGWPKPVG